MLGSAGGAMISVEEVDMAVVDEPKVVIGTHLREGDEVIRCVAAKALGALGGSESGPALVAALLDEDPDVRTDAMEALVTCARPEDGDAILRSLAGDPVKEVKLFAIEALARLEDRAAIPLLRALVKDRADDQVAWEDEAGMWDDWLDVQVAAIKALGRMQVSEAIEDLLDARTDEMGQELDIVVFGTLAEIEDGGLSALFTLLRDRDPKVRERVIRVLSKARPEAMLPMQAILLRDANPVIRRLAIGTLEADDQAVSDLALHDADPGVRKAALAAFASERPDLVMTALRDPDEGVLGAAVQALPADLDTSLAPTIADDLAANLQAWMETAGSELAASAAKALPKVAERHAAEGLSRLAANPDRPIEARVAALQALADLPTDAVIEMLGERIEDPVLQIRTAALAALAVIARGQDDPRRSLAGAMLAAAIRGELGDDVEVPKDDPAAAADHVGAPKMEGGNRRITISPEGEIVDADDIADDERGRGDNVIEGHFPTSTLAAIQTIPRAAPSDGEAGQAFPEGRASGKRRVAVDGPDDVGQDIQVVALAMTDGGQGQEIDQAVLEALASADKAVRGAAFKALAERNGPGAQAEALFAACRVALDDPDAAIRGYAATFLAAHAPDAADLLSPYADDPDPILRAAVQKTVASACPEKALSGLDDPSPLVRRASLDLLIASADAKPLSQAVDICLRRGRSDLLTDACKRQAGVQEQLLASIGKRKLDKDKLRIALETLAST